MTEYSGNSKSRALEEMMQRCVVAIIFAGIVAFFSWHAYLVLRSYHPPKWWSAVQSVLGYGPT